MSGPRGVKGEALGQQVHSQMLRRQLLAHETLARLNARIRDSAVLYRVQKEPALFAGWNPNARRQAVRSSDSHDDLELRLTRIVGQLPIVGEPPVYRGPRHRRVWGLSSAFALVILLASAVGVVAFPRIVGTLVQGYPGIENPGQPLANAGLECMSPPEAAQYLAAHGFSSVVWEVQSGDPARRTDVSTIQSVPPAHGYVVPGAVLNDGKLHMIVDERVGATGVGKCAQMSMP